MIQNEGVDSLSEMELRQACRDRGMLGLRSEEDMRKQVNIVLIPMKICSFVVNDSLECFVYLFTVD